MTQELVSLVPPVQGGLVRISEYLHGRSNRPKTADLDLAGLSALLGGPQGRITPPGSDKLSMPSFTGGWFKPGASREAASAEALSLLVLDVDNKLFESDGVPLPEQMVTRPQVCALVRATCGVQLPLSWYYPSARCSPVHPRFRAVFLLAEPVPAHLWQAAVPHLLKALGLSRLDPKAESGGPVRFDPATYDAARLWVLPFAWAGEEPDVHAWHHEGSLALKVDLVKLEKEHEKALSKGPLSSPEDQEVYKQIKLKYNLIEVAEKLGLEFEHKGAHAVALCPYHNEKTPSFKILRSDPTSFYCFGCRKSGDLFDLIQHKTGHPFGTIVSSLAKRAGITLKSANELSRLPKMEGVTGVGSAPSAPLSRAPASQKHQEIQERKSEPASAAAAAVAPAQQEDNSGFEEPAESDGSAPPDPPATATFDSAALEDVTGIDVDQAVSMRFVSLYGKDLSYVAEYGKSGWAYWNGQLWSHEDQLLPYSFAEQLATIYRKEIQDAVDKNDARRREALYRRIGSYSGTDAMLRYSRVYLSKRPADFNAHPLLLNVRNGVVDLEKQCLRSHNRDLLMTKLAGTSYNPKALCPTWDQFLLDVFSGSKELAEFAARVVGYTLTGVTREQCFFYLLGIGSNGKSTFINVIRKVLGMDSAYGPRADYSSQPRASLILSSPSRSENATPELAALKGIRMVSVSEPDPDAPLNESLIKQITGSDRVTCRHLYGEPFEYTPEFKIFLSANYKQTIRGTDEGIWRRVVMIPFDVEFVDANKPRAMGAKVKDPDLNSKLMAELPGILAWAVRGCAEWLKHGLQAPKVVTDATTEYRNESDRMKIFLDECCVFGPQYPPITVGALAEEFIRWDRYSGRTETIRNKLGHVLSKLAKTTHAGTLKQVRTASSRMYSGVALRDTPSEYMKNRNNIVQLNRDIKKNTGDDAV